MSFLEVFDDYSSIGVSTRKKTAGDELNMVIDFIDYRKNIFKATEDKSLAIFVEPKINNTYPDIIFAEYNPYAYDNWSDNRNTLELSDIKILNYIYAHAPVTSEEIISALSIKYKGLLFTLEKLYDSQLIERKNKRWVIYNKDFMGVKKVEAIEAKISKWNDVLQQALVNKNFATESWVLSKVIGAPKEDIVNTITDFGIGIYVYNNVKFSQISKAKKNKSSVNYNSLFINEWIGRLINK